MVWAHSPEGACASALPRRAPMPDLRRPGAAVGLFDNRKSNAGRLLAEIGHQLESRLGVALRSYDKPNASHPVSPETLERMSQEVGLVIAASSD